MNNIKIISNASGDWVIVTLGDKVVCSGHEISEWDVQKLLEILGYSVHIIEVDDDVMEEMC